MNPAGKSAVVGIKPTVGLVSRAGVIPVSEKQDTVGPLARTVKDAALILSAIAGKSEFDPRTQDQPFDTVPDYASCCNATSQKGLRIGVPRTAFQEVGGFELEAFERALKILKSRGAEILDPVVLQDADEYLSFSAAQRQSCVHASFASSLRAYTSSLVTNPQNIRDVDDLIAFTKSTPGEGFPHRNVAQFEAARDVDTSSEEFRSFESFESFLATEGGIIGTMKSNKIDVLVAPTAVDVLVSFSAIAGAPVISLPLGFLPADTEVKKDSKSDLISEAPGIP